MCGGEVDLIPVASRHSRCTETSCRMEIRFVLHGDLAALHCTAPEARLLGARGAERGRVSCVKGGETEAAQGGAWTPASA